MREGWLRLDDTDQQGGTLSFGGEWTLATATELDGRTRAMDPQTVTAVDLSAITRMDTAGAWLIHRTIAEIRGAGREVVATGLPERFGSLFDDVGRADLPDQLEERGPTWLTDMVLRVGEASFGLFREGRRLLSFYGMLLVKGGRLVVQPHRLRLTSLVHHLEQTGLYAVPIVALLSFLIGIVLAYQGADQLRRFGAELLTVNLLGLSILRELGALMTAIIVAGRSGSAFTAQIGTMKVNQEVDALETLGLDPVDILVLPRILALMVALPALTFLSDLVGIIGGGLMSWAVLDIPPDAFARQFREAVPINHLWVGLMKAPVFAFIIGMVGCYEGLKVTGSAESVGAQTTRAVVEAIFLVIVVDAGFSILFSTVGI
ncbi:MAG: MlaE family lipid ABC transporter permease subunit [Rhodospirillaceae bacterium]|nr:MlaE family lipid ABC transporter permease subunit [Rhodospirillaceae bacterium]